MNGRAKNIQPKKYKQSPPKKGDGPKKPSLVKNNLYDLRLNLLFII